MASHDSYRILGLEPGAGKPEVKSAYRELAKKYHPDINKSADAKRRFQEIKNAYQDILEDDSYFFIKKSASENNFSHKRKVKTRKWERFVNEEKDRNKEDDKLSEGLFYNLILVALYLIRVLIIALGFLFIALPFILAMKVESIVFAATFYFIFIGVFILWYVYTKRTIWFKLGSFNDSFSKLWNIRKKK